MQVCTLRMRACVRCFLSAVQMFLICVSMPLLAQALRLRGHPGGPNTGMVAAHTTPYSRGCDAIRWAWFGCTLDNSKFASHCSHLDVRHLFVAFHHHIITDASFQRKCNSNHRRNNNNSQPPVIFLCQLKGKRMKNWILMTSTRMG